MLSMMGGGKPEGHPEGGDPGKCPFAMMMKAAEARPDMVEKWKAEAAECDSDSSEDEEEAAAMEALLATHAERSAATRAEMEATVRELEGQGEERERRERMMQAMKHQFSKQDLGSAAAMIGKLSPSELEKMKAMASEMGAGNASEGCPFSAMFGAIGKQDALAAGSGAATGGELAKSGHGNGGGDASSCPFAAMFGGAKAAPKPKALPDPAGEPEDASSAVVAPPKAAGEDAAGASCPFAAMFGMPEAPAKKKPVSIVEKYMRDNNLTEADLAAEAEEDANGGCPFAKIFGAMPSTDEKEAARQKTIQDADKPGQGQYIWKRQQPAEPESEEESEEEEEETAQGRFRRSEIPDTQEGLNDAIKKAGEIKSAKMKADPRRREWEAAPVWMKCTCADEGELGDARQLDFEGKLEQARAWREQANALFKEGKNEPAISLYAKSLGIFLWFKRGENRSTENIKLINDMESLEGMQKHQVVDVVTKAFVNIAACLTKMSNWKEVIYACGKALEYDPRCIKALYRRAHAYRADNSAYMLELAVKDLRRALSLDPANADVKRAYRQFAGELKEQNKKDGRTFGEMFSRGDLYTAEEAERMQKEPASKGSILGEMDEGSRALAKQMGIDLNDPRVRAELARLEAVQKAKEGKGEGGGGAAPKEQHWWIKMTLKYKWVVYCLIALHVTWRMWVAISSLPLQQGQLAREVARKAAQMGADGLPDDSNVSAMFTPADAIGGVTGSEEVFDEL